MKRELTTAGVCVLAALAAGAAGFYSSEGGFDETAFSWSVQSNRFHFAFDVVDATVYAVEKVGYKRDLERGDRVEVFFCPAADLTKTYYCAEMDPRGRVLDYACTYPRKFDYDWGFRTLKVKTARTAKGYAVEGSVSVAELKELGLDLRRFGLGAFRADYDGKERLVAWYSKMPPGPGEPDFHRPCMMETAALAAAEPLCAEAKDWKFSAALSDEFDGAALDRGRWDDWCRTFQGRMDRRQPLDQCSAGFIYSPKNVSIENGELTMTARKLDDSEKTARNEYLCYAPYSSSIVKSVSKQAYGYFEIRAKTMKACINNAFWLYDALDDEPRVRYSPGDVSEEIDIFEQCNRPDSRGKVPDCTRTYFNTIHFYCTPYLEGIVNYRKYEPKDLGCRDVQRHAATKLDFDLCDDYHTYGFLWTPEKLVWYLDGKVTWERTNDFFHRPMHVTFTTEFFPGWFGLPADSELPAKYRVDYVRVWECPPPRNTALVPRMKIEPDGYDWFERHDKILKYGRETNPEIVFLGDSITHFWAGRDTIGGEFALPRWKKAFGQYRTLNLGYGWDRTGNVLWRLDHGEMDGVDPKLVVIHIGGNNYSTTKHYQGNTSEEVAEAILAIAAKAHEKAPKAKVVVMGVFPFGEKPDAPHRQKALKTNEILAEKVPALGYAAFIDLTAKQIGADGIYPKELARDRVHPTDAGYDIWVEALKPYLPSAVSAAEDRTPVKITSGLADWQIVPREADGFATVALEGTWIVPKAGAHDVYVRVVREDDFSPVSRALDWHAVETETNGTWRAKLRIPCGGLYRLETLRRKRGLRLDWNSKGEGVSHFGVGDVWVIAGQSNADGNGRSPAFDPPEAGVHVFRHCGEWGLASHPLHDGTRSKYAADYMTANHSPWLAFAKTVRARTGVPVGLVPAALGGSGIASWLPEKKGELFRAMERICDDACGRRVKGILWYQGCTDTLTPEGTNYYPHLASFIRQARAAFRNPELPILSVQINRVSNHPAGFWTPPRWDLIREVQRKAAHEFSNHWLVSSMDCVFDDCIHNSSESNVLLGRRVADVAFGKVYGFDIACLCPDVRSAVRADDALSVTVAFDNVTGEIVFEPRDPALFPFLLRDEDGEVPLKAVDSTVGDTLVLKLGRALKGKATLVGCPGTCPFIGVPHDMPSYRPMLAFTVDVK